MKEIRQISKSSNKEYIALAEFEKRVQIFDIINRKYSSEFDTVLDFGGNRLAINHTGEICICGAYYKHGICGYNTKDGSLIWQRKDLKKVQNIQILESVQNRAFIRCEDISSRIINITNGEDLEKIRGVESYYDNKNMDVTILDKSTSISLTRNFETINIPRKSFATLSLTIAPSSFVVSEAGVPLSCYSLIDGLLKWRIEIGKNEHFLNVAYNDTLKKFIGVKWPYVYGGNKKLNIIDTENGIAEEEIDIGEPVVTEFALNNSVLITSDKKIIDLINLTTVKWN